MNRRTFLTASAATAATALVNTSLPVSAAASDIPPHLKGFEDLYALEPRAASRAWFREAQFGLFMHYGVYSQLKHGEWVMLHEKIPVSQYHKLKDTFRPDKFDADFITDMALDAGMKYVNITSRHHDSFSLFATKQWDWNSVESAAKRDLVAELAEVCQAKGLGLFLYYSYAADWSHPWFYAREAGWEAARPDYDQKEPAYKWQKDEDSRKYISFVHAQLKELLTNYGPLAGIWLDPIMGYYARPDLFPIERTYRLIRSLQPHCLISFKQGANGDEDFATPERHMVSLVDRVRTSCGPLQAKVAQKAWDANRVKQLEICDTLLPKSWGYDERQEGNSATPDDVMGKLEHAHNYRSNLLLNTGPMPDGSIPERDVRTLREVGKRLRRA
jgi:alpha-L-fucosidase